MHTRIIAAALGQKLIYKWFAPTTIQRHDPYVSSSFFPQLWTEEHAGVRTESRGKKTHSNSTCVGLLCARHTQSSAQFFYRSTENNNSNNRIEVFVVRVVNAWPECNHFSCVLFFNATYMRKEKEFRFLFCFRCFLWQICCRAVFLFLSVLVPFSHFGRLWFFLFLSVPINVEYITNWVAE